MSRRVGNNLLALLLALLAVSIGLFSGLLAASKAGLFGAYGRGASAASPFVGALSAPSGYDPPTSPPVRRAIGSGTPSPMEETAGMSVRIRLSRVGATGQPSYRVVATDRRSPRDGRSLEILGHYNPRTEPLTLVLDLPKIDAWIAKGAQPSDVVTKLIGKARSGATALGGKTGPKAAQPGYTKPGTRPAKVEETVVVEAAPSEANDAAGADAVLEAAAAAEVAAEPVVESAEEAPASDSGTPAADAPATDAPVAEA